MALAYLQKLMLESLNFTMIEDYMSEFDFNDGLIYENKNLLEIMIYGYDDDPRELYQIYEITTNVNNYFRSWLVG